MEPADVLFQKLHLEINLWIVRSSPERLLFFLTFSGGMNLRWGGFQKSFCLLAAVGNFLWRRRSWSFSSEVGGGGVHQSLAFAWKKLMMALKHSSDVQRSMRRSTSASLTAYKCSFSMERISCLDRARDCGGRGTRPAASKLHKLLGRNLTSSALTHDSAVSARVSVHVWALMCLLCEAAGRRPSICSRPRTGSCCRGKPRWRGRDYRPELPSASCWTAASRRPADTWQHSFPRAGQEVALHSGGTSSCSGRTLALPIILGKV